MKKLLIITQKVDEEDQLLGFFVGWLRRFAEKFGRITIICLEKGKFDLPANVEIVSLGKDKGLSKAGQLFNFYSEIIGRRNDYDAIFVHMNPIWVVVGGLVWRAMKKKIFFWYTSGGVTFKLRVAEKLAHKIFTASKESFRLPSNKVLVTGHGIDTDFFKPDPVKKNLSARTKILSVGRIAAVKNYGVLIKAAKILKKNNFNFQITIIGEPALERDKYYELSIKEKIKELSLESNFNFLGKIDHRELLAYYQSHDIFVHLSQTGSVDKTLLEAMSSGMKVISSNDSAKAFLPGDLICSGDNPDELARKIIDISSGKSESLRSYVVENHNLNNLIEKISSVMIGGELSANTIFVYPFPSASKHNKYIELLYGSVEKVKNPRAVIKIKKYKGLMPVVANVFNFRKDKHIVHIHWENILYGSHYFLKSMAFICFNFSILLVLKTLFNVSVVWTMHNLAGHDYPWPFIDKIGRKLMFSISDAIIIQQKETARCLAQSNPNKKIVFLPHGNYINSYGPIAQDQDSVRASMGINKGDLVLLSLGIVKPYKKIECIMEVIKELENSNVSQAKLAIAGSSNSSYGENIRKSAGDSKSIVFDNKFIPDQEIPAYLRMADYSIFWYDNTVLTSGGIILSLSYGVPVIARNIEAAELIESGKNGFKFSDKNELKKLILELITRPRLDNQEVMDSVKDLGWDKIASYLVDLYVSS